jgi:hypothetical protein
MWRRPVCDCLLWLPPSPLRLGTDAVATCVVQKPRLSRSLSRPCCLAAQAELQRDEQETVVIDTLAPLLPRATAKHNYPANPEDFQGVCAWASAQSALHVSQSWRVVAGLSEPKETEVMDGCTDGVGLLGRACVRPCRR